MKALHVIASAMVLVLIGATVAHPQQTAEELYQAALYQEEVKGDLEGAIGLYQRILNEQSSNRVVSAKAQLHIGICYETCDPLTPVCRPGYTCPNIGIITDVCIGDCQASSECNSGCCEVTMNPFGGNECVDPAGMPAPMCINKNRMSPASAM